jgi:beta-glucosidase
MSITDNVITPMVTGADGVLAGVITYDAMLPNINNELPKYKNDPVIVSAMREACHHNLYALVNSSAMNGIGPNTVIKAKTLPAVLAAWVVMILLWLLFIPCLILWLRGRNRWFATAAYQDYKNARKNPVHPPVTIAEEIVEKALAEEPEEKEE